MPILIAAAVACVGFWCLAGLALESGHPNEDAYILFKYVDNLVAGHGIVFHAGGPPTEGATDFLWLLLLSGTVWLGADVAVAALLWNGLGAGLAAGLLAAVMRGAGGQRRWWWALAASLFVLLFHGSVAAMSGFSSMLFSALLLSGCVLVLHRSSPWLPALGLGLALFRPEGVVPGVAFAAVGWFQARRQGASHRRCYLVVTVLCLLLASAYLAWHRLYFGLWFPLSVYVKTGGVLPGLFDNLHWLHREIGPLPFLATSAWILWRYRPSRTEVLRRLWCILPVLLLLVPLTFAVQTQNVRWRFQAPITLAVAWFTWELFAVSESMPRTARWPRAITTALMILAMAPSWIVGARRAWQLTRYPNPRTEYTATFAPLLADLLTDKDTILLTEAGILAYWSPCHIVDVVGLNDARFARDGATMADIVAETGHPAVVMFNAYETLDLEMLRGDSHGRLVAIDRGRLARAIRDPAVAGDSHASLDRARQGARALATFLAGNDDYHLRAVFLGRNNHVYGFRKDHVQSALMLVALARSCAQEQQGSYAEVKRARVGDGRR